MTARENKIKEEAKSSAREYLKKAADNYDQMLVAFNAENWNAAATLALQCAISSADAICVHEKGIRSISVNHLDVCDLVAQLTCDGADDKSKQLRKVIRRKNMVQYECRNMYRSDVDDMVKVTVRIYQWVQEIMRI